MGRTWARPGLDPLRESAAAVGTADLAAAYLRCAVKRDSSRGFFHTLSHDRSGQTLAHCLASPQNEALLEIRWQKKISLRLDTFVNHKYPLMTKGDSLSSKRCMAKLMQL